MSGLLVVAALAHLGPEHLAQWFGHSIGAWEYVCRGIEGMCLWLALGLLMRSPYAWAVCAYGAYESALMSLCRTLHPMTGPPRLPPGQGLCTAAGLNFGHWSPVLISFAAFAVALYVAKRNDTCKV